MQWFCRQRFFKRCQCIFTIISPCNRSWPFNGRKFNPLHPRMLFVKFVVIGPVVLGKIVKRGQCIVTTCISLLSLLRIAFIWRKGPGHSLKEIWIPFTQEFFCAKFGSCWTSDFWEVVNSLQTDVGQREIRKSFLSFRLSAHWCLIYGIWDVLY